MKLLCKKSQRALVISADEFFEMGRYLVLGASLAAILQTFISQTSLLTVGSGPILSVLVMLALAVLFPFVPPLTHLSLSASWEPLVSAPCFLF